MATGLFPASGFVPFFEDPVDNLHHMVLPAVVLGTGLAAVIMRQTRSAMLDSLSADYVRTARAKGLRPRAVISRHALRNSLIVVVTIVGLQLGGLISGAVVTEQIFVLPGFGKLTIDAVFHRDYPVIQAVVLVTATAYIVINLLVDLLYSVIDPRIRVTGDAGMTVLTVPMAETGTASSHPAYPGAAAAAPQPARRRRASSCSRWRASSRCSPPWLAPYSVDQTDFARRSHLPAPPGTCSAPTTSAATCSPASCSGAGVVAGRGSWRWPRRWSSGCRSGSPPATSGPGTR